MSLGSTQPKTRVQGAAGEEVTSETRGRHEELEVRDQLIVGELREVVGLLKDIRELLSNL